MAENESSRPWLPGDPPPGSGPVNCEEPQPTNKSTDELTEEDGEQE